jgi:hypothetical protein
VGKKHDYFLRLYKQHNPNLNIFGDKDFIDCEIHHPDIFFTIDEGDVVYRNDKGKDVIDIEINMPKKEETQETGPKAKDYLFAVYPEGDSFGICIVSREYWNENKCIDDQHFEGSIDSILPKGFDEVSEATFDFNGPLEQAIALLTEAGFERIPDNERS